MNKKILIIIAVIIGLIVAWYFLIKKKSTSTGATSSNREIPEKVAANLDGFLEGEKMKFEGVTYVVLNGNWVSID